MMGNAGVNEIQITIEQNQEHIDMGAALERLLVNPDFERVVMDGFMRKEAHRLAILTGDPSKESAEDQAKILRDMNSIGALYAHFRALRNQANIAKKTLAEHLELEAELAREEAAGDLEV